MRVLLDTHTFLWWTSSGRQLSPLARDVIGDPSTEVLVSVASIWEIAIKSGLGRLTLDAPVERFIPDRLRRHAFTPLDVVTDHAVRVASLPGHHSDPFDRLLVAQAQVEGIPIVTTDPLLRLYDVDVMW